MKADSDPSAKDYTIALDEIKPAINNSIKKLGFIPDLFLIHGPDVVDPSDLKKTWQILEEMKAAGELKEIGVSNFRPQDLELILDGANYKPAVNQVKLFLSDKYTKHGLFPI